MTNFFKQLMLLAVVLLGLPTALVAQNSVTLASWTFEGGYDAVADGATTTYTPNGGDWAEVPTQWFNANTPVIRPDSCIGTITDYALTMKSSRHWSICSGWNNHVARMVNDTEANDITDYTDASKHNNYYEFSMPTKGYKNISFKYACAYGGNAEATLEAVVSTDGGTTWTDAGATTTASTWWTYKENTVTVSANNKDKIIVRLIAGNGLKSNWNLDYLTVTGEKSEAGTAVSADGVTASWPFDGTSKESAATMSQDGLVSVTGLSIGSDLTETNPQAINGENFNKVQPKTSNVGTNNDEDAITLMITPKNGLTFTPSHLHFKTAVFGTNGGKIDVVAIAGSDTLSLMQDTHPNRNNTDPTVCDFDITGLTASYSTPFYAKVYVKGLANNKQIGFRDFVVTGKYEGTVVELPSYTFSAKLGTEGAGSISVKPAGSEFDEGTEITLSVTENFGYHFTNWTDASGAVVSEANPYTFNITANTELTANFSKKEVYALNLNLTNGARSNLVTVEPQGNVVDCVHHYEEGTNVKLTAINNKILTFTGWEDNTTSAERNIVMDGEKNVTANFSAADYIVGWDLYDDEPASERAADYKADTENAGLLSLRNEAGKTSSWLSRGRNKGDENGKWAARIWKFLSEKWYFEISFSTNGYKNVTVSNDLGNNYNSYTTYYEQASKDGKNYVTVGTFTMPNRGWSGNQDIQLPDSFSNCDKVYVRWYPDYSSPLIGVSSDYDGLAIAEIYVLAESESTSDDIPPVLVSSNPENNATGVSASGSIVLNFDEKVKAGTGDATLDGETLQPIVSGKTVVYKYSGLKYATAYTFTIPSGAITDRNGNAYAGTSIAFTTMERTQPAARLYDAIVAADGTGDYTTLQAAIDAAPSGRTTPWLIFVKKGTYTGHVTIPAKKPYIHIIGQDKNLVTIADNRCSGGDNAYGINDGATLDIESDNDYIEGVDLQNSWGVDQNNGPQALALCSNGDKLVMNNMKLRSYQDTWFTGGGLAHRTFITNSWIEGAVDFFYGQGDIMIYNDSINIVRKSGGYIVAPNHPKGTKWGYVFLNNVITAPGIPSETSVWLGRPWHAAPKTVYINTKAEVTIPATGWYETMGGLPALWAEYNTMDGDGNPVDLSHRRTDYYYIDRATNDTIRGKSETAVLTAEQAAQYTIKNVCGGDDAWNPELICEPCAAPQPVKGDDKITWDAVPYAICYVITKGDEVVGFTTDTEYAITGDGTYKVQAANEFGGLSKAAVAGKGTVDGITEVNTGESAKTPAIVAVYTIDGKQTNRLSAGLNIVRYADGTVKKVMK